MEKLLALAKKVADQIEIYSKNSNTDQVNFENSRLKEITSEMQYGVALRIVKDGKLGFAYTRNLLDREKLVQNALCSLKGNVAAEYEFPLTKKSSLPLLQTYDSAIEKITNTQMVEECEKICDTLKPKTKAEIFTGLTRQTSEIRILNSAGTDLTVRISEFSGYVALLYPGSFTSITRNLYAKKFEGFGENLLNSIVEIYNQSLKEAKLKTGKMPVLFMPEALYALIWRLKEGANPKNIYERVSPIQTKLGEKILSEQLTIVDESLADNWPSARAFDDEGTLCQNLTIIEAGVFKNFYTDLNYAQKLRTKPSGNGYRVGIASKIMPALNHLTIKPGKKSLADLIRMMNKGIIIEGVMGAHSGNILNGDFSVGLSPGIYVENGEIVGRVKDAMVAGNIYEVMKNVIGVSDTLYPVNMGMFPAILFDDVSVAIKN